MNEYAMEHLVRHHLSALREAARHHTLAVHAVPGPGLRVRLGRALIVAGEWLRAGAEDPAHAPHA